MLPIFNFHKAIHTTKTTDGIILDDDRTGLSITLHTGIGNCVEDLNEIQFILGELGFYSDLDSSELRSRQLPYRRRWQAESQRKSMAELLQHITTHVPYYRERMGRYKTLQYDDSDFLKTLPILLKKDLQSNAFDMISEDVDTRNSHNPFRISWARTSGTTGEQIQVPVDMALGRVPPGYEDVWGIRFEREIPRTAVLTTPRCTAVECHLSPTTLEGRIKWNTTLFCKTSPDPFNASNDLVREFVHDLWEFRPEILVVNPIFLHVFLSKAATLDLKLPAIKIVLSTYQYISALQRRYCEHALGVPVRGIYSATELGGCQIAVECRCGRMHVREDHCLVEIETEEDKTSDTGPLLVTNIANRLMPLIRYRVGDLVCLSSIDCECELQDWQCLELHGRESETLSIFGRTMTTKEVDDLMSQLNGIDFYQIQQSQDLKTLNVHVICSALGCDLATLSSKIEEIFSTEVRLTPVASLRSLPSQKIPLILPREFK